MFGILGFLGTVSDFFTSIWTFIAVGALGAIAAAIGFTRGIVGGVTGFLAVILVGAAIVGGVSATQTFQRLQGQRAAEEIARLEAENRAKAAKVEELQLTNAALNAFLNEERETAKENADVLARLNAIIDATEDNPDCTISEDFLNELDNLR
jgi:uncharacterized protein YlxW (UPF0749 family)